MYSISRRMCERMPMHRPPPNAAESKTACWGVVFLREALLWCCSPCRPATTPSGDIYCETLTCKGDSIPPCVPVGSSAVLMACHAQHSLPSSLRHFDLQASHAAPRPACSTWRATSAFREQTPGILCVRNLSEGVRSTSPSTHLASPMKSTADTARKASECVHVRW